MTDLFTLLAQLAVSTETSLQPRPLGRFEAGGLAVPGPEPDASLEQEPNTSAAPAPEEVEQVERATPSRRPAAPARQPEALVPIGALREAQAAFRWTRPNDSGSDLVSSVPSTALPNGPSPPAETSAPSPAVVQPAPLWAPEATPPPAHPDELPTRPAAPVPPVEPGRRTRVADRSQPDPYAAPEPSARPESTVPPAEQQFAIAAAAPVTILPPDTALPPPLAEPRPPRREAIGRIPDDQAEDPVLGRLQPRPAPAPEETSAPTSPRPTGMDAPAPAAERFVHVTIGRIEVRAEGGARPQPSALARRASVLSLEDYLRHRSDGSRR